LLKSGGRIDAVARVDDDRLIISFPFATARLLISRVFPKEEEEEGEKKKKSTS
jgi:hypothetical protein